MQRNEEFVFTSPEDARSNLADSSDMNHQAEEEFTFTCG